MGFLSWLFFCLSPFALFCTEDGGGLLLCPVFIVLGFVFKYIENSGKGSSKAIVRVDHREFWEWHYKERIKDTLAKKDLIGDHLMSAKDKEAKSWATTICGYHNAWVPPEATQEQIARANGVITEKMIKERNINKDRIQIGKYFLLRELEQKYRGKILGKDECGEKGCYPARAVNKDCCKIKLSNGSMISEWMVGHDYNMTIKQMWDSLTVQEKEQATKWIKEYEKRLLEQVKVCIEEGHYFYGVRIEF